MYYKKYNIRWSDIDANRHLSHSSYHKLTADIRITLINNSFNLYKMLKINIGTILFYEEIFYFNEFLPMETIYLTLETVGLSNNGKFFKFNHNFYKKNGIHSAYSKVIGSWIDLNERKLITPPKIILELIKKNTYSKDFKILTKEDTRVKGIKPKNINFNFE